MAKVTEADVDKIARLAHLLLTDAERSLFTRQLDEILGYAERIQALDTTGVEPTSHALLRADAFREDREASCLPSEEALQLAPEESGGLFKVPRVIP